MTLLVVEKEYDFNICGKLQVFMTIHSVCSKDVNKNLKTTLEIDNLITF